MEGDAARCAERRAEGRRYRLVIIKWFAVSMARREVMEGSAAAREREGSGVFDGLAGRIQLLRRFWERKFGRTYSSVQRKGKLGGVNSG